MTNPIFTLEEAARKIGVSVETLEAWVKEAVAVPSALADRKEPYFDDAALLQLEQIRHLHEIGYTLLDIKKITRKVGLPEPERFKQKKTKTHHLLTVGELADRSGQSARTIKYWEERGIIEPSTRTEGGHRLYDEACVLYCTLIHDLQLFGYSLEEVKEAADLFRVYQTIGQQTFAGTRQDEEEKLDLMLEKISTLFAKMADLSKGIERWRKLLKEKQAEIQALRRKKTKEEEKGRKPAARKAQSPSPS